jgi:lysozyme
VTEWREAGDTQPGDVGPPALWIVEDLCKRFEGFRSRPYLCPANVWTIGYGATTYLDGRAVHPGDAPINQEVAERLLERQITGIYLPGALRLCPTADTPGRQAALADFAFNLGLGRLKASTLRKRVLAQDWDGAAVELGKWVRGGGWVLPGLVLRRAAEVALLGV